MDKDIHFQETLRFRAEPIVISALADKTLLFVEEDTGIYSG